MLACAALFWQLRRMARMVTLYGLALALIAAGLEWLQYRYMERAFPTEIYIALLAIIFIAIGIWVGRGLTPPPKPAIFERNDVAIRSLGLTAREQEILQLLASGQSNKEMARVLNISPNTVKTHVARLYEKLSVQRRMQAVEKARWLALIE